MTTPPREPLLQKRTLAQADGLLVEDVLCLCSETGWSEQEYSTDYGVVFPRRGVFMRRAQGQEMLLDPGVAYFEHPGIEQQVAHPRPGGDSCTAIKLPEPLVTELLDGEARFPEDPVFTDGDVDLAQRALVARLQSCDGGDFEVTERAIRLTADALGQWRPRQVWGGRPATARARRRLVNQARELLAVDPTTVRLTVLARQLAVSPHHLSRVFHEETGQTLARHRNRLRVRLALERIEGGERNLAGLAADLGFADHAHLTRTVRREVGRPPVHMYSVLHKKG